jgi:crotonobetainyl-CoA:carnitine CoA-transferase CaiB-like acyl-CoA transferase
MKAGHDINYMALSGLESHSGKKETGPSLSGLLVADISGGSKNVVIGILAAYIKRLE